MKLQEHLLANLKNFWWIMAKTAEGRVKEKVVKTLKDYGVYYFYPVTGGYGASGVPDIIGCYHGTFFGIECKAGKGKTTALQDKNLNMIAASGGYTEVINEENIDAVSTMLDRIARERALLKL